MSYFLLFVIACSTAYCGQVAAFTSGVVLLLYIWGRRRSGLSTDPSKEMDDVDKCMRVLTTCENKYLCSFLSDILIPINICRWHSAGRLWDILFELASVGDLPLPNLNPQPTNKRDRDISENTYISSSSSSSDSASHSNQGISDDRSRNIATNRRVASNGSLPTSSHPQHPQQQQTSPPSSSMQYAQQQQQYPLTLPVYSDELSQLPVYSNPGMPAGTRPPHIPLQYEPQQQSHPPQGTGQYWDPTFPLSGNVSSHTNLNIDGAPLFDEAFFDQLASAYPSAFGDGVATNAPVNQEFMSDCPGNSFSHGLDIGDGDLSMQATDVHRQRQRQAEYQGPQQHAGMLDNETMAMWSTAPTSVEYASFPRVHTLDLMFFTYRLEDWGVYLSNLSEFVQNSHNS